MTALNPIPLDFVPLRKSRAALSVLAISLGVSSCANIDEYVRSQSASLNCLTGGLLGAATGALAAAAAKGDKRTIAGAAVAGGAVGCVVALSYKDRLTRLDAVAREHRLKMQTQTLHLANQQQVNSQQANPQRQDQGKEVGLAVQVQDEGMFPSGSARPSPAGERQIRALASAFADLDDRQAVLVVGHTDATGSAQANQQLSEQRARAMADLLVAQGIGRDRMYFQGAGASRPIADNADPLLRGQNRRVEIVLVDDVGTLTKRDEAERNNPEYLVHGTATEPATVAVAERTGPQPAQQLKQQPAQTSPATRSAPIARAPAKPAPAIARPPASRTAPAPLVDFGGGPSAADDWALAQLLNPKRSGFALISSARASNLPLASCASDSPRVSGEVKHLASGKVLNAPATRDYLPGMNGRAWAGLVNGHLVTVSPVSVLREGAVVAQAPKVYVTRDYEQNKGTTSHTLTATANTWEGEDSILYRVFVSEAAARTTPQPLRCLDVVLPKNGTHSLGANLVYARGAQPYAADFTLLRN